MKQARCLLGILPISLAAGPNADPAGPGIPAQLTLYTCNGGSVAEPAGPFEQRAEGLIRRGTA